MSAVGLSEPQVLAISKEFLYSKFAKKVGYAVTDTQFATKEWREEEPINEKLKSQLSPFNHVRVGSGYPDLVGAIRMKDRYYRGQRSTTDLPPLVIVEAKGYRSDQKVDAETGIVQAHDRLSEANLAFLAVPSSAVTEHTESLARELNVGIIGVQTDESASLHEKPRLVGSQVGREASAIRLQAGPQGVADNSFTLNRPKNYLGYPVCIYSSQKKEDRTAETLLDEYVVGDIESVRNGAAFLGLTEKNQVDEDELTPLGEEIVRFGLNKHRGSIDSLLSEFESWKGRRKRLTQLATEWALVARLVIFSYPATQLLTATIQELQKTTSEPTLPELVQQMYDENPTFAIEFFIRDTDEARSKALDTEGNLNRNTLNDVDVYRSTTSYQYKQMLYHCGILSEAGKDTSSLLPEESIWALENPL